MTIICGVEEAGRGPVIGPMVMCGVAMEGEDISKLKAIGVKDSKLLSPRQRESMFEQIKETVKNFEIITLSAQEVDAALESEDMNLNWLEAKTSAKIINKLNPDKAILDCPSNNIKAYEDYVKNLIKNKDTKIIAEHKADLNHIIVGAASILAKVTRDRKVKEIKDSINIDFGSGYPSDPKTKEFLEKNWQKYPEIFRKTWSSYKRFSEAKNQKSLGEF